MLDDELRALVSVDPSTGWHARVRDRVAADAERTTRVFFRRTALTIAAIVVVAVGALLWPRASRDSGAPARDRLFASDITSFTPLARPHRPAIEAAAVSTATRAAAEHDVVIPVSPRVSSDTVQVDSREASALQDLFAMAADLPLLDVREPQTGPIVVPQISIEPILDSPSEGDRP